MAQLTTPGIQPVFGTLESEISRSYNSFSGSDITAVIGNIPFAEIQAISYSVTREKAPVYTMGSPDPRAFSRNKRGIAGSLIWINFDRHALLRYAALLLGELQTRHPARHADPAPFALLLPAEARAFPCQPPPRRGD